ncbi:MAG: dTDP-glucose 4,6-dehydratase [Pseudomonadota bacterium]
MKLLVTGGAGFIGSNFVRYILKEKPDLTVVNVDLLTYAGNLDNLADLDVQPGRYEFIKGDITDPEMISRVMKLGVTHVVNFAAESHVDRSIMSAAPFIHTNVLGTQVLLDAARAGGIELFVQVSTDEVYGQLGPDDPPFTERTPLAPRSPYAASKAASDLLCQAAFETHRLPVIITRCSNNYGPYQFPEKLLPLMLTNALEGKPLPVYGDGRNIRDWIYVSDHCRALGLVLERGRPGRIYNIGGQSERTNLDFIKAMLAELSLATGQSLAEYESLITFVQDRPGHDRRYAINAALIREELGVSPLVDPSEGLARTVEWYLRRRVWWERIKSGEYHRYYEEVYGRR